MCAKRHSTPLFADRDDEENLRFSTLPSAVITVEIAECVTHWKNDRAVTVAAVRPILCSYRVPFNLEPFWHMSFVFIILGLAEKGNTNLLSFLIRRFPSRHSNPYTVQEYPRRITGRNHLDA